MPNIYQFSEPEILAFILVLVRISAFLASWPVFGVRSVPTPVKILFGLALSLMLFPVIQWKAEHLVELGSLHVVYLTAKEILIGVVLGFLARMFFYAVHIAGEVIALSMGLANARIFNPGLGTQSTAVEQFHIVLATLFFLAIEGHHLLLAGLVDSFRLIPLSVTSIDISQFKHIAYFVQEIMEVGLKISAPVLLSILFMNVAMAVIGRAIPQINVLITSLPINILVGFLVILIVIPMLMWEMHELLELTTTRIFQVLKAI